MSAQYEWRESEDKSKDLLFRDGVQVGEVSAMGQLYISAVWRPSKVEAGQVDDYLEAVKGALLSREGARLMTLKQAQFSWEGVNVEALRNQLVV